MPTAHGHVADDRREHGGGPRDDVDVAPQREVRRPLQHAAGDDPGHREPDPRDRQPGLGDHLGRQRGRRLQAGGGRPGPVAGRGDPLGADRAGQVDHARAHGVDADLHPEPARAGPVELQRAGGAAGGAAGGRELGDEPGREQLLDQRRHRAPGEAVRAAIRARDTGSSAATVRSTRARLCRRTVCCPAGCRLVAPPDRAVDGRGSEVTPGPR